MIDKIADTPDLQAESATSSTEEEIVGEAGERPLLEAVGSSKTYFNDMVCVGRDILKVDFHSGIQSPKFAGHGKDFLHRQSLCATEGEG